MKYFYFAVFFALNFSLCYMLPSFLLKSITRLEKKKKKMNFGYDYIIYGILTIVYIAVFILFYNRFNSAINNLANTDSFYFNQDIEMLSLVTIGFLIISILYNVFSYKFGVKLFKFNEINFGYLVISFNGFFNILSYFFLNAILKLNLYAFEAERYFLNMFLKIDYQVIMFLFPALVFTNFALSFVEEK